ncbi:MAG: hypothetical protein CUN49_06040 [Candidatus Thermofonsia Clade 1 bacterium]|uniref:CPBP family intramembrane metalloprotease n=1 Tax=Candidatus Thermofonsia Clade 1 bacterium TaxID=2364210 RepID=A0A2M8PFJ8_9CHLR|nr:MAG: hypothetical protein CUN49_06040 [Candidatus Thermofonsia Clade 1 bacterium]
MPTSEAPEPAKPSSGSASTPESPAWMKAIVPPEPEMAQPEAPAAQPVASVTITRSKPEISEPAASAEEAGLSEATDTLFEEFEEEERPLTLDPLFIYSIALVVTVLGLGGMPLETRLTLVWTALSALGLMAILVDEIDVPRPSVRDLAIGGGYAALVGVPILVIGSAQLGRIANELFSGMSATSVFLLLIFAMPAAETLFFRGAFQASRGLWLSALASGVWSCLLLLAGLNVTAYPLVALVIGAALMALNFLYAYLAAVYNLFSAWACQILMNALLLWLPSLL